MSIVNKYLYITLKNNNVLNSKTLCVNFNEEQKVQRLNDGRQ